MDFDLRRALISQKALAAHPALMDSTPISTYAPGANNGGREKPLLSQREAPRHSQAYGGNQAIDHVYDCIGLYADPLSTAPYHLEKLDGTKLYEVKREGTPKKHEQGPQDLYDLLNKPNPYMLYDELMSLLIIDLLLVGNAYWMKWQVPESGRPLALYRMSPSYVKIVPGPYGPDRYEYQPPGVKKPMKISPDQIIHFRRPNPHSPYYGMGVIQGGGRAMDLEIAVTETMSSYYENKADPSLIVESERRVPRDVMAKLRAQLRARVAGPGRAGELLVLESGLAAKTLSRSAADNLFKELSMLSRDRIYTKFRVSPLLFGLIDENSGSNKVSDARREFDNYALRPVMQRLATAISEHLTAAWGVNYVIDHRTLLPAEDAVKVAGQIASVPGIKIIEVRAQYAQFGIEPSTGDPEIDEMVLNLPTPEIDANGMQIDPKTGKPIRAQNADRNLPTEPGRPPKPSNTVGVLPSGKALSPSEILARLDSIAEGKALTEEGRMTLPGEKRPADTFAAARRVDLDTATTKMAAELRQAVTSLERELLDGLDGKALSTKDIVQRMQRSPAWVTFKDRLTTILEEGALSAAKSGAMHADRAPDEEIDYEGIVQSTVHRPDGIRSIVRTIKSRISNALREARDGDGERAEFEAAVKSAINDWSTSQAITIADSEATEAYNEAVLTTLEMSGETEVYVEDGEEHDDDCKAANGSVWSIDEARKARKAHPRCRRAFLSLAEAEVA